MAYISIERSTLRGDIVAWLDEWPGFHTTSEVATGVGVDHRRAYRALVALDQLGVISRRRFRDESQIMWNGRSPDDFRRARP